MVSGSVVWPLLDVDEATFAAQLRNNVLPAFLAIRTATSHMAARGGSIVCISSVVAVLPYPLLTPYGVATYGPSCRDDGDVGAS